ncbi:MAG: glutamate-1-semialdehyde 2,1-aminomutase [Elusimicrobia bacterium]|nr:glutamate-1-semialdehyde 2,1-aminomutase [Elusimicrobiota bacterium]
MNDKKSRQAYQEACKYIPGGVNSPVRAFRSIGRPPLFIKKAAGPYITDIDDNSYIDHCLSWGVHILGHNNPAINKQAEAALIRGISYGAPTVAETELARRIINAVPSIEKIRFVNSGTEAVMSALRLARAFTRRKIIVKFDGCYHGHADYLLLNGGSGLNELKQSYSAGVPPEILQQTLSVPFNDQTAVRKVFAKHGKKIAAIIVEPVPANMGVILPHPGFLQFLRDITSQNNSLLIFDEVITGFRLQIDGAQGYFGINPDLTCLGKIIGGGFPTGAFGGKREIMDLLAPDGPVYQAGTLSGNPLAMSAGIAVLKEVSKKDFYKKLNGLANDFTRELKALSRNRGGTVNALGSMFSLFFSAKEIITNQADLQKCNNTKFRIFYQGLLAAGIYLSPSPYEANFLSSKHSPEILHQTLSMVKIAI